MCVCVFFCPFPHLCVPIYNVCTVYVHVYSVLYVCIYMQVCTFYMIHSTTGICADHITLWRDAQHTYTQQRQFLLSGGCNCPLLYSCMWELHACGLHKPISIYYRLLGFLSLHTFPLVVCAGDTYIQEGSLCFLPAYLYRCTVLPYFFLPPC